MVSAGEMITVGKAIPRVKSVKLAAGWSVEVTWASGSRAGQTWLVNLSRHLRAFAVYRPLRSDDRLFSQVEISHDGSAIIWPGGGDLEVSADVLDDLCLSTPTRATVTSDGRPMGNFT